MQYSYFDFLSHTEVRVGDFFKEDGEWKEVTQGSQFVGAFTDILAATKRINWWRRPREIQKVIPSKSIKKMELQELRKSAAEVINEYDIGNLDEIQALEELRKLLFKE